jgi:uncharacterized protein YndB with AHSA1/START domain
MRFPVSTDKLWEALTEPKEMRKWFFQEIPDFKPIEGFEIAFSVFSGGRKFIHQWRILKVKKRAHLRLDWRYAGYPGESIVDFYISEAVGGSRLDFKHRFTSDFPDEIPEFSRESCAGGWQYFLLERLPEYLSSHP